ncbi:MAG: hypothetical protein IID45_08580 [Planctomycetes bacterium]|nr:hypothetical protein [Planctomycetota bacterium]
MRQIKLFKHIEAELTELENEVNTWLRTAQQKGSKILNVSGNISPQTLGSSAGGGSSRFLPSDILLIVEYELNEE